MLGGGGEGCLGRPMSGGSARIAFVQFFPGGVGSARSVGAHRAPGGGVRSSWVRVGAKREGERIAPLPPGSAGGGWGADGGGGGEGGYEGGEPGVVPGAGSGVAVWDKAGGEELRSAVVGEPEPVVG